MSQSRAWRVDPSRTLTRLLGLLAITWPAASCRPARPSADDDTQLVSEVIARSPECVRCSLEFAKLGQLGGLTDTILLTRETMVAVLDDGRYLAAPTSRDGEAAIFDTLGATARLYGRLGDGPGENGRILNVLPWSGDSVLFAGFDRLTILGGERGQGRTIRLERTSPSPRTVALPREDIVVRNYSYPPDRQFVAFNRNGSIQAEMGSAWKPGFQGDVYDAIGELGPALRPYAFWSAPQRYRIQMDLWDARDGSHLRTVQDTAPWYTPYDSAALMKFILGGNDVAHPPPPFLRGIRESHDSFLWLLYNIPARNWTPTHDSLPPMQRRWRREAYDGVLDLRDATSGKVLLTAWTNLPLTYIVNDSLLVERRQTEDGFWVYVIYKVIFLR